MGKLNRALSIAIRDYCSKHEMLPIFVSMDTNNDTNAAKEGEEICHGMLLDRSDSATLNDVISRASLAIGARFHFLIFALCRGVRIVPINADLKINALSNEIFSSQALKIGKRDTVSSIVRKITRFLSADCKECDACEREEAIENMSKRALADIQRVSSLCSQSQ
jgi:polysaccharide pyruvyl transferase WcaK-like protein